MADVFKLKGEISVDNDEANESLDKTSKKGQETESKLNKAFGAIGRGAAVCGKAIAAGLAAGAAAMAGLTMKALNATGELEQNMGGSEAVFGEYAGKMQETARSAFETMGLSTSEYLATANQMGALFQGSGFSIEESMNLSTQAMQRAADVASIMGIDTATAMEAVAGAAKGNFTMMDNLGVAMNDTALNAYALEIGLGKTTDQMTQQEKTALAMEMFMDRTAYAAGNYAAENQTLAGSLGTAKAALTNFLDGSGDVDQLVGAFTNAANVIVGSLTEILPRLTTGLTEVVQGVIPLLPPLLQQLLPALIEGAVSLINGLVSAMPAVVSALMAALPALIDGVMQITNALIQALPQLIESIVSALPALIPQLISGLVSMIVTLCTSLPDIIMPIIEYLPEIIVSIVNALVTNLPVLIEGAVQMVVGLVSALPQIIIALVEAMPTVLVSLAEGLISGAGALIEGMTQIWNSVSEAVGNVISGLAETLGEWASSVGETISTKWSELKSNTAEKWESIKSTISEKASAARTAASNIWNSLKTNASSSFNSIKSTATSVWNGIKSAITNPIETAKNTVKNIVDTIKGFFSNMNISFPHIKLPHFSISPAGWKIGDLLEGSIPSLGISWYAKAMNNPMIMDSPTIFGYNPATGELQGGGDAGSEVVSGTNTLMNMIGTAVENKTAAQTERIIAVMTAVLNAILSGNAELLKALLAGQTFKVGEREFARLVKEYA